MRLEWVWTMIFLGKNCSDDKDEFYQMALSMEGRGCGGVALVFSCEEMKEMAGRMGLGVRQ